MINFKFQSLFGGSGEWNKIVPSRAEEAYRGAYDNYIIFNIKGVNGQIIIPQPHITNLYWAYRVKEAENPVFLINGKCTEAHVKMILEFISGKKWQSRIKKAYSARNRWVNGKPV